MKRYTFIFLFIISWGISLAQQVSNTINEDIRVRINKHSHNQVLYGEKIGFWQYYHESGKLANGSTLMRQGYY